MVGRGGILQVGSAALAGGLAVLLVGCGATDTATPATPVVTTSAPSPSQTAKDLPRETAAGSGSRDVSGPSFGVDRAVWPADAKGASKLLNSLPQTFRGETLETYYAPPEEDFGASAGAQYGTSSTITVLDEYVTNDTESGKPELFRADQLLAASFGLGYACAEGSYRGTIQLFGGESEPGPEVPKRSSRTGWFSCRIDGAEGDEDFKGHAVGWTSRKAAWLVITEDAEAARALIAALGVPTK
jgi:hypothetical protein